MSESRLNKVVTDEELIGVLKASQTHGGHRTNCRAHDPKAPDENYLKELQGWEPLAELRDTD